MPELPEVEQVRKTLLPHIQEKKITAVTVRLPRQIIYPTAEEFVRGVTGRTITNIGRRGKYLRLELADDAYILVHLRMTGALIAAPKGTEPPYAKVHFALVGEEDLWFTDIRTFGTLYLIRQDDYCVQGYATLGPEPLSSDFTPEYLAAKLAKRTGKIKSAILDQKLIAGLGNIYADESLFAAGIAPQRAAKSLTKEESERLWAGINKVIAQGIKNRGTTFRDYKDGEGNKGSNQLYLNVYGRRGEACKVCGQSLEYITVGGRGSVYCPHCQG